MDTILGVYLVGSIIILLLVFGTLIGYGSSHKEPGLAGVGIAGGIITILLFAYGVSEYHGPKAMDVYQGKTTLEYTVKDGVKTDSVVVYKDGNKQD